MSIKVKSDEQLISSYLAGSEKSLNIVISRHRSRLLYFIVSKVNDISLAEDIFQDTYIKVINNLKRGMYNEQGKFLPWVMRIAHNLVIDHFRKNNRMPKFNGRGDFDVFSVISDGNLNIESKIVESQIASHVRILLEELPEDQKTVIKMRIYQDMSFKEIEVFEK